MILWHRDHGAHEVHGRVATRYRDSGAERGKPKKSVSKIGAQGTRRGTRTAFRADPQMFETTDYSFDMVAERLRESAYLTKGVWITLIDERVDLRDGPPIGR